MTVRNQIGRGLVGDYWCGIYEDYTPSKPHTDANLVIHWNGGREWTLKWKHVLWLIKEMESDKKRVWKSLKRMDNMNDSDRVWLERRRAERERTKEFKNTDSMKSPKKRIDLSMLSEEERVADKKRISEHRLTMDVGCGVWCDMNRQAALCVDDRCVLYNNEARLFRIDHDKKYIYVSLDDFVKALRVYADREDLE